MLSGCKGFKFQEVTMRMATIMRVMNGTGNLTVTVTLFWNQPYLPSKL